MITDLASHALRELAKRQEYARRYMMQGLWNAQTAAAKVAPWAAIAIDCGADLPALSELLGELEEIAARDLPGRPLNEIKMEARNMLALELATMAERREAVTAVRDIYLDRLPIDADPATTERCRALMALGRLYGAPAWTPKLAAVPTEERAAA